METSSCQQFEYNIDLDIEAVKDAVRMILESNSAQFIYSEINDRTYKAESVRCRYLIYLRETCAGTTFVRITCESKEDGVDLGKYVTEFLDLLNLYIDPDEDDEDEDDERYNKLLDIGISCIIMLAFLEIQVVLIACMLR